MNKDSILILGAGPAGLAAGFELSKSSYISQILENFSKVHS